MEFSALNELGINRISLGVQSFQLHYLNLLDRRHSALQAGEAIDRLRGARFKTGLSI
jgi:coproporphyrinogen III oxidase-like Fe-S oxidoreductase